MIMNLVRKDFMLVRKYVYIMLAVTIAAPPLLLKQMRPEKSVVDMFGTIVFFLVLFMIILLLSSSVSLVDETYKKGCAYLCTTPYSGSQIVISKYVFTYIVFCVYCIIYKLESLILPDYTVTPGFALITASFAVISIFRCVLIPLEYRFGYEKAKYIIMLLIIGTPFISSMFLDGLDLTKIDFSKIINMNLTLKCVLVAGIIAINGASIAISCKIFNNKDLS